MNLLIDHPLPGVSGTSNDGNTARKFFENWQITSEILNLNSNMIFRFSIILRTISSHYCLNFSKFSNFTRETAELYVKEHHWYPIPNAVHKPLVHGSTVASNMSVPLGMMSEEAQESRNRDFKNYRQHHARQFSRQASNTDLIHRLLKTSDPVISMLKHKKKKKSKWEDSVNSNSVIEINNNINN